MLFEKTVNAILTVEGMHCNHCKAKVENALKSIKGIKKFEVSLENATASVDYLPSKTNPEAIAESVTKIGFEAKVK